MSRSRRDFLKIASGSALATPLLIPAKAAACCFGRPRGYAQPVVRAPGIWISSPQSGTTLDRTFTAYGSYALAFHGTPTITSRLFKESGHSTDADTITKNETDLTWMADFIIDSNEWQDGATDLILEVKMTVDSTTYEDYSYNLTLLGVQQPPLTIDEPTLALNRPPLPEKPRTGGNVNPWVWGLPTSIQSYYVHQGGMLSGRNGSIDIFGMKWRTAISHDLSGHTGKKGISLVVNAQRRLPFVGLIWQFTTSQVDLYTPDSKS